jgi:HK97 family phage portal protein
VLANGVAQVPWRLYRSLPGKAGAVPAVDHPLYDVLYRRPNPWQTSFEFRQTMVFHRALTGNFYAFKSVIDGQIRELIPIEPGKVEVQRQADMTLRYLVTGLNGQRREFPAETIWHLRGASWDSWKGLETVRLAREAIGLAVATETAHAELHRNGIQTSGLYSIEGTVTADQYKLLRAFLKERIDAHLNHEPMIMDRNAKFTPTIMNGVDAQHIETRRFQVEEICRAFNVKPIMIGHSDKTATYASAEQMFLAHAVHTLGPWYEEIDQSADVNLIGGGDPTSTQSSMPTR